MGEEEESAYDLYSKNKPETSLADTGIVSGNMITAGIAKSYAQTIDLEDKYKKRIENNKVASILEKIRLEQGEAAYKKEYSALSATDMAEYTKFLKNNINEFAVATEYALAAASMALGIMNFNYQEYIVNPFAALKTIDAIGKATDQIVYTEKALEFIIETRSIYQEMLAYKGR